MPPDFVQLTGSPDFLLEDFHGGWVPGEWASGLTDEQVQSVMVRGDREVFTLTDQGRWTPLRYATGPQSMLERASVWLESIGFTGGRDLLARLLLVLAVLIVLWAMSGKR